jgi:hypothetical protein
MTRWIFLGGFCFLTSLSLQAEKITPEQLGQKAETGLSVLTFDLGCKDDVCLSAQVFQGNDKLSIENANRYVYEQAAAAGETVFFSTRPSVQNEWTYTPYPELTLGESLDQPDLAGLNPSKPSPVVDFNLSFEDISHHQKAEGGIKNASAYILNMPKAIYQDFHTRTREELSYVLIRSVSAVGTTLLVSVNAGLSFGVNVCMVAALAAAWNGSMQYLTVKVSDLLQRSGFVPLLKPVMGESLGRSSGLFLNRFVLSSTWILLFYASLDLAAGIMPASHAIPRVLSITVLQVLSTHEWASAIGRLAARAEHNPAARAAISRINFSIGMIAGLTAIAAVMDIQAAHYVFGAFALTGHIFNWFGEGGHAEKVTWVLKRKIYEPLKGLVVYAGEMFGTCNFIKMASIFKK